MMKRYVIERDLPGVGEFSKNALGAATKTSNAAIASTDGVQWEHSYVTGDKTFCVYLAENVDRIREHADKSGFPANVITEVVTIIDPTTEQFCTA